MSSLRPTVCYGIDQQPERKAELAWSPTDASGPKLTRTDTPPPYPSSALLTALAISGTGIFT